MSRGPSTFRARNIAAAIRAVVSAGFDVLSVAVDKNGRIVVTTTKGIVEASVDDGKNEWDNAT